MWIMTSYGFVALADQPAETRNMLLDPTHRWDTQIRGRDFRTMCEVAKRLETIERGCASPVTATADRDYEWRIWAPREVVAAWLNDEVLDMDYTKFKPTTERYRRMPKLHDLYTELWYVIARHYASPILRRSAKRS